jgi:p-aminobenzoyl-glutamate transporter AbgT
MLQASMLALDTSRFQNVYYAENTGSFSTTSVTYVDAFTASFTIANPTNKHILLASAMLSGSSTASSFACKLQNTTTATDYCVEHLREPNVTSEELPTVVARIVTFSGASNTIAWQLDVETAATTGHLKNMMIVLLDLGTT